MAIISPAALPAAPTRMAIASSRSGTTCSCSIEQLDNQIVGNLPKPSIDTGMGLERIAAVMQGVHDNYDTDTFKALIAASGELTKTVTTGANKASHRVIADHLRSAGFLVADGVLPANEGRGYVLRRIMRRAMRHAHLLGAPEPLMHRLVPSLVAEMGAAYPELVRAQPLIEETLKLEEETASARRSPTACACSTRRPDR
jgi:alanyl-tRNA synthetase